MKILLIEDETELANILSEYLQQHGFQVTTMENGQQATHTILNYPWDMVLLDLMLPGLDGVSICQEVRQLSMVPIIMLTARVEEVDRLIGLEVGADDYICKPYSPREVVARVKSVLRRTQAWTPLGEETAQLVLDDSCLRVQFGGRYADLTLIEFRILATLTDRRGRILSRDQLMDQAYDDHRIVNDRTIDSHINKLRKKLVTLTGQDLIRSVYGAGYTLEDPEHNAIANLQPGLSA